MDPRIPRWSQNLRAKFGGTGTGVAWCLGLLWGTMRLTPRILGVVALGVLPVPHRALKILNETRYQKHQSMPDLHHMPEKATQHPPKQYKVQIVQH
eukprot:1639114-Amphidinium_carterae.1